MSYRFGLVCLLLLSLRLFAEESALSRDGVQTVTLSPRGEYIALLKRQSEVDHLVVATVEGIRTLVERRTSSPQRIIAVSWLDNQHVVLEFGEDKQYKATPLRTGKIEILSVSGERTGATSDDNGQAPSIQALADKTLLLVDSLPALSGVMLVQDISSNDFWTINVQSGLVEQIEQPLSGRVVLTVSPNLEYLIADGYAPDGLNRVVAWKNGDLDESTNLDSDLTPISVSNSGIAYATKIDEAGVKGLVAVDITSSQLDVLFQDEVHDAEQILLDPTKSPFAVRYHPGYPSWNYLRSDPLTELHESLRAALPESDVTIVSMNFAMTRFVVEVLFDIRPSDYFLIDAISGQTQRLLGTGTGLFLFGGDVDAKYHLQPFSIDSRQGSPVSGFISTLVAETAAPRPTVILLKDRPRKSEWKWEFNEEVDFFSRQGLNVLLVNHRSAFVHDDDHQNIDITVSADDVEDAIQWAIDSGFSRLEDICIVGAGTGAELALIMAGRIRDLSCMVSREGDFAGGIELQNRLQSDGVFYKNLRTLLIFGADDSDAFLDSQIQIQNHLRSREADSDVMVVAGEARVFSQQINGIRALARIESFVRENIGGGALQPVLPMTYQQAVYLRESLFEYYETIQNRSENGLALSQSLRPRSIRDDLSDEQAPIYRDVLAEITSNPNRARYTTFQQNVPRRSGAPPRNQ